jgi:catechol 2,3-dioxygenase-like lactoylglutathione lyase family enzyme
MTCGAPIPILRIFDEAKAREYYVGFLGFKIDWENRFEPDAPLYAQISRGRTVLHLSEHHGDSSPGAGVRIPVGDLDGLHAELTAKKYKYNSPGIQTMPWGLRELTANDPFMNRITFFEEKSAKTGE